MLLKLQKYDLIINYVKGKDLHVADALSRANLNVTMDELDSEELELPVHTIVQNLPVSGTKRTQLLNATENDEQLQQLSRLIKNGWPTNITNVPTGLRKYWKVRHNLYMADQLILMKGRVGVPSSMRTEILTCIHKESKNAHQEQGPVSTGLQCTQPLNKKYNHALYASHIPNKTKESPCYLTQSQPDHGKRWGQTTFLLEEKTTC